MSRPPGCYPPMGRDTELEDAYNKGFEAGKKFVNLVLRKGEYMDIRAKDGGSIEISNNTNKSMRINVVNIHELVELAQVTKVEE